jgi:hypothetical protein
MTALTENPPARSAPAKKSRTLAVRLTYKERMQFRRECREAGVKEADMARARLTNDWPPMTAVAGCRCATCEALRKAGAR